MTISKATYEILLILKDTLIDEGLWLNVNVKRDTNIQADLDEYEAENN